MGIADNYSRGRRALSERPKYALAAVVGAAVVALLLADLAGKLGSGTLAVSDVVVFAWRGVVNGLVIGLAGVGLSMTYSILNFANFAHGDYITSGAFVGWAVAWMIAGFGEHDVGSLFSLGIGANVYASQLGTSVFGAPVALALGLVAAGVGTIAVALLIDKLVYEPMRGQGGIALLIASIGVAFILRYLIVFVWGTSVTSVATQPGGLRPTVGGVTLSFSYHELTLAVCAVALMVGVHVLLQRTKLGKAMRAMSDNEDLARVTGIPTERVIKWTWIIGAGLAGVAGYLLILEAGTIAYSRGWILLLLIFAAVILGGIGSVYGAMLGGLVIGLTDSLSIIWIPSDFTKAAAFALMILILLFRPSGLFAGRTTA
jgi:branched-chain amino acid transport system permease protein